DAAAFVKLNCSARARKYWTWCISMGEAAPGMLRACGSGVTVHGRHVRSQKPDARKPKSTPSRAPRADASGETHCGSDRSARGSFRATFTRRVSCASDLCRKREG